MKRIPSFPRALLAAGLVFTAINGATAEASFLSQAIRTSASVEALSSGSSEKQVLQKYLHNLSVYEEILFNISSALRNPNLSTEKRQAFILAQIENLERRRDRQLGAAGRLLADQLLPGTSAALTRGKVAARQMNTTELRSLLKASTQELRAIRTELNSSQSN